MLAERDPARCRGASSGVDVVIESTGLFTDRESAAKHLAQGAKKVVISAPATDPDATVVLGVNFDEAYDRDKHDVISPTPRARPTASRRWRRCSTTRSASSTA